MRSVGLVKLLEVETYRPRVKAVKAIKVKTEKPLNCGFVLWQRFCSVQRHFVQLSNSLFDFVKCKSRSAAMPKYTRYTRDGAKTTDTFFFLTPTFLLQQRDEDNAASFGTAPNSLKANANR